MVRRAQCLPSVMNASTLTGLLRSGPRSILLPAPGSLLADVTLMSPSGQPLDMKTHTTGPTPVELLRLRRDGRMRDLAGTVLRHACGPPRPGRRILLLHVRAEALIIGQSIALVQRCLPSVSRRLAERLLELLPPPLPSATSTTATELGEAGTRRQSSTESVCLLVAADIDPNGSRSSFGGAKARRTARGA